MRERRGRASVVEHEALGDEQEDSVGTDQLDLLDLSEGLLF